MQVSSRFEGGIRRVGLLGAVTLLCCFGPPGCGAGAGGDARTEELWVVDFQTHAQDVAAVAFDLDLDMRTLERATMNELERYYAAFPIRFITGVSRPSSTFSSICIRNGGDHRIGRAALDIGNDSVDFNCGQSDGLPRGVFIDRIAVIARPQINAPGLSSQQRAQLVARLLALALAHEVGHGLGLEHTNGIMASLPDFDVHANHAFTPLQAALINANIVR